MKVLFTGHAGLAKKTVLKRFCQYIYAQDPTWRESSTKNREGRESQLAQFYEAEMKLIPMVPFLDLEWRKRIPVWRQSINAAITKYETTSPSPEHAFLSIHLSYQWRSSFFSPLSWRSHIEKDKKDALEDSIQIIKERFNPDYCVTLIDDVQAVQHRIVQEVKFRLRELMTWRNYEVFLTDLLAKEFILKNNPLSYSDDFPFDRSPVVAIRHPPEMLYKLLFKPELLRIYASYPITSTRQKYMDQINRFRYSLHEHFSTFDPVTIDERPLITLLENYEKKPHQKDIRTLTLKHGNRWPIPPEKTLCFEKSIDIPNISIDEIKEIAQKLPNTKAEIDRNILDRDFRLIDQADCVVVYRPKFMSERLTGGTKAEIEYAKRTQKPVFVVHDPVADGQLDPEVFGPEFISGPYLHNKHSKLNDIANQTKVLKELVQILKTKTNELTTRRRSGSPPN